MKNLKKLCEYLVFFIAKLLLLINRSNIINRVSLFFFKKLIQELNKSSLYMFSYTVRPIYSRMLPKNHLVKVKNYSDSALILQGPLNSNNNFTYETVKLYLDLFDGVKVIVSTWEDQNPNIIRDIEMLGATVIKNKYPKTSGSHNINYQQITTKSAIDEALRLNCKYALKSRTDVRANSPDFLNGLICLLKQYPINNKKVQGRIIELGATVCLYRPWSMCDIFQFGYLSDLNTMWTFPLDNRTTTAINFSSKPYRVIDIVNENVAEIFIHRNFAYSLGVSNDINYEHYYNFIKNYFIILDKESVDAVWFKYEPRENSWAGHDMYRQDNLLDRMTHLQWIQLVNNESIDFKSFLPKLYEYENVRGKK